MMCLLQGILMMHHRLETLMMPLRAIPTMPRHPEILMMLLRVIPTMPHHPEILMMRRPLSHNNQWSLRAISYFTTCTREPGPFNSHSRNRGLSPIVTDTS